MELSLINKILNHICAFIGIVSLVASLFAIIVFSRKKFHNTIFSTYFRLESIFDMLSILVRINYFLKRNKLNDLKDISNATCKLYVFIDLFIRSISAWILVLISFDRFLSIVFPTRFLFRKKFRLQLFACLILFSSNILFSVPIALTYEIYNIVEFENKTFIMCYMTNPYYNLVYVALTIIVPFILMFIFTLITLSFIYKSRRNATSTANNKIKDLRFAVTSISLNISFFVLIFPEGFFVVLDFILFHMSLIEEDAEYIIYDTFLIMSFLHYGSTFYLTLIVNSIFRKELFDLILDIKIKLLNLFN
jgi:hypothetical protein